MADVIDAIIAEALGEGPAGMAAVAHVINTRALQTGKTPEQVINEAGQFSGVSNPGRSVAQSMKDPAVRAQVQQIWDGVTAGQIPNPFPNADFFHTPQVSPDWASSYDKLGQTGNHIFYSSGKPVPAQSPKVAPVPADPIMRPATQMASTTSPADNWLTYSNQEAIRNQPLSEKLTGALSFLPELGVTMEVFSGGETEDRKASNSGRHLHGDSADAFFYKDGERLDWANPQHRPIFETIVQRGKENGITGFGAGDGYMRPGSMHLGFGAPAVWGAGGKGSAAPDWLRMAYSGAPANPAVGAINSAAPVMRPASGPKPAGGIMGGIGAGIGSLLGFAGAQAAPIMRGAQAAGQNAVAPIMRSALGSVAGRTALIDPMIKSVFNGTPRANAGSGGIDRMTGTFRNNLNQGPAVTWNDGVGTDAVSRADLMKYGRSGPPR